MGSAGASLDSLNRQSVVLKDHNVKLENSIEDFKNSNIKLDRDLRSRKAYFEVESQSRVDYEQAIEDIVQLMIDECNDKDLVNKIMVAQSECMKNIIQVGGK